ncbi:uncharacterized protein LOC123658354 isoform X2 [Melitaea cinxia]|uniref:uncharacterized protein LOC123658354 isoform X2 n=1 Tax=Melitaea cinxia TaxID=113334 RepID=UPI001E270246|nr:uncharacterized protein LOC123658354 isoform X2 [Melitaea cinxia]
MLPQKIDKVIPESFLPNEIIFKPGKDISESVHNGSYCSCSPCDLVTCFELRNRKPFLSCTCSMCQNPDTCAVSNKNLSDEQFNSKNINDIKVQNEIEEIETELCSEITKVANTALDNREYTKFSCKDVLLKRNKIDWNVENKCHDKSTTRQYVNSVAVNYLPNEGKNSTAELTAQIMNMPYQDFKDSLSIENSRKKSSSIEIKSYPSIEKFRKNSFSPPKSSFEFRDIMKPDFLTRLKEIYNACSCKVCECITGTSLLISNNECNCKPCDCDECTNNIKNQRNDIKQIPNDGCPCVSCDRKDCRGVVKKTDEISCSCVPCDCVKCAEDFSTSCDCEPCQCIECKALGESLFKNRTVIVAPAHENIQHNVCQCEPCDCVNCTHNYSSMASSLRHQVSTEIILNRHCRCDGCSNDTCQLNSEDCRCEMQSKVMKKPIERASRDYDIHSTLISCQNRKRKFNNKDTIVTFALCNNNCNTISYSKVNDCFCSNCECLVCKEKGNHREDTKRIHSEILNRYSKPSLDSFKTCKCSPCECQMSRKSNEYANKRKEEHLKTSCECNKCDCFACKGILNIKHENIVRNKVTGLLFSEANSHFLRKGKIFIPSTFEVGKEIVSQQQSSINLSDHNLKRKPKQMSYFNVPANNSSSTNISCRQIVRACHTVSKHRISDKVISENSKFSPNDILLKECFPTTDDSNHMVDEISVLRKGTKFSERNADNNVDDKLCEIFNANKPYPIRDMVLLDTIIHLTKSLSKTNVSSNEFAPNSENVIKNKYSDDKDEKDFFDRKVPCIPLTPKESAHTILLSNVDGVDENFDEKNNFERLNSVSSKTYIMSCDKKSSSLVSNRNVIHNMGSISVKNNLESDLKVTNDKIYTDSTLCGTLFNDKLNESVGLKTNTLDNDLKVKDIGITVVKSKTKCNSYKSTIKCIGKKYNKMYNKLNKIKQNKDTMKEGTKNIKVLENRKGILSVGSNIFPLNDKNIENLEHSVTEGTDSVLQTTVSSTMTPHNIFSTKDVLHNIIETQTQNIDTGDNREAWSIMKKNLYLNGSYVTKIEDVCTVPLKDFHKKTSLKSISMQTSAFLNNIGRSSGNYALTKLLIEVNDLLNSPLLKSSHSSKKCDELEEILSHLSKVYLPRNTKLVMDNLLTNTAYKSDELFTKPNLVQGYLQNMPKINSCQSSCHGLKATFIGIRTISDHTVMVKWRLPREVAYVQGYELQVDGRPVQKIFSPTRCMAILTCLPHSEKLLLTIRTLATSNLTSDHQPATTIVYRPRVKC